MKKLIFITGNQHKAKYLSQWLDMPVEHRKLDLDELQSLDLRAVVEHKVRQAYDIVKQPVIVEDASLTLLAMGRLPGTFIKWFLEEMGNEGLMKLADGFGDRSAVCRLMYAYYDGVDLHLFEGVMEGAIARRPKGTSGFGFDPIFINNDYDITRAEMAEPDYIATSYRAKAIKKLQAFLQEQQPAATAAP